MKRANTRRKILFAGIAAMLLFCGASGLAQDYDEDAAGDDEFSSSGENGVTQEEVLDFRKEILEALGLPTDQPTSLLEILQGKRLGLKIPERGPLTDLKIVLNKNSMRPGDKVTAVVAAKGIELAGATVTWEQGGKTVLSGVGEVSYKFTVGRLGADNSVRAIVKLADGTVRTATKPIYPSKIHLTWSSDGYTPAWYRGKALPMPASSIAITAIADIRIGNTRVNPASLYYEWKVNNVGTGQKSSKNTLELKTSKSSQGSYRITVTVSDPAGSISHTESFLVGTFSPQLVFYERDALYGAKYNRAVAGTTLRSGGDLTVLVEPFFIPRDELETMEFRWLVNNNRIENPDPKNRIFHLTTENGARGDQNIYVIYSNTGAVRRAGVGQFTVHVPEPLGQFQ